MHGILTPITEASEADAPLGDLSHDEQRKQQSTPSNTTVRKYGDSAEQEGQIRQVNALSSFESFSCTRPWSSDVPGGGFQFSPAPAPIVVPRLRNVVPQPHSSPKRGIDFKDIAVPIRGMSRSLRKESKESGSSVESVSLLPGPLSAKVFVAKTPHDSISPDSPYSTTEEYPPKLSRLESSQSQPDRKTVISMCSMIEHNNGQCAQDENARDDASGKREADGDQLGAKQSFKVKKRKISRHRSLNDRDKYAIENDSRTVEFNGSHFSAEGRPDNSKGAAKNSNSTAFTKSSQVGGSNLESVINQPVDGSSNINTADSLQSIPQQPQRSTEENDKSPTEYVAAVETNQLEHPPSSMSIDAGAGLNMDSTQTSMPRITSQAIKRLASQADHDTLPSRRFKSVKKKTIGREVRPASATGDMGAKQRALDVLLWSIQKEEESKKHQDQEMKKLSQNLEAALQTNVALFAENESLKITNTELQAKIHMTEQEMAHMKTEVGKLELVVGEMERHSSSQILQGTHLKEVTHGLLNEVTVLRGQLQILSMSSEKERNHFAAIRAKYEKLFTEATLQLSQLETQNATLTDSLDEKVKLLDEERERTVCAERRLQIAVEAVSSLTNTQEPIVTKINEIGQAVQLLTASGKQEDEAFVRELAAFMKTYNAREDSRRKYLTDMTSMMEAIQPRLEEMVAFARRRSESETTSTTASDYSPQLARIESQLSAMRDGIDVAQSHQDKLMRVESEKLALETQVANTKTALELTENTACSAQTSLSAAERKLRVAEEKAIEAEQAVLQTKSEAETKFAALREQLQKDAEGLLSQKSSKFDLLQAKSYDETNSLRGEIESLKLSQNEALCRLRDGYQTELAQQQKVLMEDSKKALETQRQDLFQKFEVEKQELQKARDEAHIAISHVEQRLSEKEQQLVVLERESQKGKIEFSKKLEAENEKQKAILKRQTEEYRTVLATKERECAELAAVQLKTDHPNHLNQDSSLREAAHEGACSQMSMHRHSKFDAKCNTKIVRTSQKAEQHKSFYEVQTILDNHQWPSQNNSNPQAFTLETLNLNQQLSSRAFNAGLATDKSGEVMNMLRTYTPIFTPAGLPEHSKDSLHTQSEHLTSQSLVNSTAMPNLLDSVQPAYALATVQKPFESVIGTAGFRLGPVIPFDLNHKDFNSPAASIPPSTAGSAETESVLAVKAQRRGRHKSREKQPNNGRKRTRSRLGQAATNAMTPKDSDLEEQQLNNNLIEMMNDIISKLPEGAREQETVPSGQTRPDDVAVSSLLRNMFGDAVKLANCQQSTADQGHHPPSSIQSPAKRPASPFEEEAPEAKRKQPGRLTSVTRSASIAPEHANQTSLASPPKERTIAPSSAASRMPSNSVAPPGRSLRSRSKTTKSKAGNKSSQKKYSRRKESSAMSDRFNEELIQNE